MAVTVTRVTVTMEILALSGDSSDIGSYWESGFKNQIDIVAINHLDKKALLAEVKRNEQNYAVQQLKDKSHNLVRTLSGYAIEYRGGA